MKYWSTEDLQPFEDQQGAVKGMLMARNIHDFFSNWSMEVGFLF